MIVLGADLSYTRTGLVWLDHNYKVVRAETFGCKPGPKRLLRALKWFRDGHMPVADLCIIEDLAFAAPSRTVVAKLAELAAIFKLTLEAADIDYLVVSPTAIKKAITGKGTAEKHVVARELKRAYGLQFESDTGFDLSDAAACAVWGVKHGS